MNKMNLLLIFPISIGLFILFMAISLPIMGQSEIEAVKGFCESKGMEYIDIKYCVDGDNAIEIKTKTNGMGYKKSDYDIYIVATR